MQCAGMIGEAVGRTRFRSDGLAMMSTLMVSNALYSLKPHDRHPVVGRRIIGGKCTSDPNCTEQVACVLSDLKPDLPTTVTYAHAGVGHMFCFPKFRANV